MTNNTLQIVGRTALVVLLTATTAQAGDKLTWFGEASFSGAYPQESETQNTDQAPVSGLMDASTTALSGSRFLEQQLALDSVFSGGDLDDRYTQRIRSEVGLAFGDEAISVPVYYRRAQFGTEEQLDGFGIKWRHSFEDAGSLTMTARYGRGEDNLNGESLLEGGNRLASVSWTSGFDSSGITGSLYIGDEQAREAEYTESARMIYGFAVGGHWLLGSDQTHTPYVFLRYQDSDQAVISGLTDYDKYTQISAGWNWQVKSNWRLRAEANITYDQPRLNLFNYDRTRFQFSTRFDIK